MQMNSRCRLYHACIYTESRWLAGCGRKQEFTHYGAASPLQHTTHLFVSTKGLPRGGAVPQRTKYIPCCTSLPQYKCVCSCNMWWWFKTWISNSLYVVGSPLRKWAYRPAR